MGGWEPNDDPLQEHLRGNESCAWAVLRDLTVRSKNGEEFGDDVEDPKSEKMNGVREATFGKWWPHDDKKGWNPKSKKVSLSLTRVNQALTVDGSSRILLYPYRRQ